MIPISVTLEGFLSFKEKQTLDFDESAVWMLTGKNGAGKSSVFDAMRYALYGEHDRGKQHDIINHDCDACAVSFVFAANGKRFRAERRLQRGRSAVCALYEGGKKDPIEGSTKSGGFDEVIQMHVGLTNDAFTWAVLLRQGQAEVLLDKLRVNQQGNSKAYELLKQLIDLSSYDLVKERAKDRYAVIREEAKQCRIVWERTVEVGAEEIEGAEAAVEATVALFTEYQQKAKALDELLAPSGSWDILAGQRNKLSEDLKGIEALLVDADGIRRDIARHDLLTRFIPLRRKVDEARTRFDDAERLWKDASDILENLPTAEELDALSSQVKAATHQLPYLRQRDKAEEELRKSFQQRDTLEREAALLPDCTTVRNETAEAQVAKDLYPYIESLERARTELQKTRDRRERQACEISQLLEKSQEDTELHDRAFADVEQLRDKMNIVQGNLTTLEAKYETAREALAKRDATRGSQTCAYCGQPISAAQWEDDFAKAQRELQDARENVESATQELKQAQDAFSDAESIYGEVDERLTTTRTTLASLESSLKNLDESLEKLGNDIQVNETHLPSGNRLSRTEAKEKADRLPALQKTLKQWEQLEDRARKITIQIEAQTQVRADALDELPDTPLATKEAERLASLADALEQDKQARQVAEKDVQKYSVESQLLRTAWEQELRHLPDAPERDIPLDDLDCELEALAQAPTKKAQLDNADNERLRIESVLRQTAAQIELIPEKARCPSAEIKAQIQDCNTKIEDLRRQQRKAEEAREKLRQQREERITAEKAMEDAENRARLWKELDKQLGQPLQNWLLKEAEARILEYGNTYLDAFSAGNLVLEPSEDSIIPLDLVCRNDLTGGNVQPLQSLSGSQKFRVAVSLALALGQFASSNSQRIQSVIIDEGFGGLDADGQREMSSELRNLAHRLERLIIVSHQETFADAFHDRYDIRLENGGSVPTRAVMA